MPDSYPWYAIVEDHSLEQGDFYFSCPVFEPLAPVAEDFHAEKSIIANVDLYDVILLSQSCDLAEEKLQTVLACPHWPLDKLDDWEGHFRSRQGKEDVRRGNVPGLHMLARCELPGFALPVRVVSFRQVFSLPFGYIRALAGQQNPRLRLLPPYREHLAQAFARFIMRVGLPVDIPPFK
jgi:hypothetical protein